MLANEVYFNSETSRINFPLRDYYELWCTDVYYTAERTLIDGRTILKIILGHVGVKHANDPSCCGIIRIYRLLVP